jgi:hypothetical protein
VFPGGAFLSEDAATKKRGKYRRPASEPVILEVRREEDFDIPRVQNMMGPRADQQILAQHVSGFVVLGHRAQKGEKAAISIGIP